MGATGVYRPSGRSRPERCVFFNDTATTEIYTLSLHDALPISAEYATNFAMGKRASRRRRRSPSSGDRSEEHTSELQAPVDIVCRLLLEKKESVAPAVARRWRNRQVPSAHRVSTRS